MNEPLLTEPMFQPRDPKRRKCAPCPAIKKQPAAIRAAFTRPVIPV